MPCRFIAKLPARLIVVLFLGIVFLMSSDRAYAPPANCQTCPCMVVLAWWDVGANEPRHLVQIQGTVVNNVQQAMGPPNQIRFYGVPPCTGQNAPQDNMVAYPLYYYTSPSELCPNSGGLQNTWRQLDAVGTGLPVQMKDGTQVTAEQYICP